MDKKVSLTRAQISKRWRENNPKAYKKSYTEAYSKNKDALRKYQNAWRAKNPDYTGGNRISDASIETWAKRKVHSLRSSAKRRGHEFSLTCKDILGIVVEHCPVSGTPLEYTSFTDTGKIGHTSPSVDRIDNLKGYTKDNVMIVSAKINRLKGENGIDELLTMCHQMIEYYGGNNGR